MSSRRQFIRLVPVVACGLIAGRSAVAQVKLVDEKSAQAVAVGYVADTSKVDKAKFPKWSPDQNCANCQLYTGKPGDASGGCALFPGQHVTAKGWCNAWVKKA